MQLHNGETERVFESDRFSVKEPVEHIIALPREQSLGEKQYILGEPGHSDPTEVPAGLADLQGGPGAADDEGKPRLAGII